ncbi:MAG: molybdopterin dinucleotide binding domain-containing protein [Promethearchaeota archaeon]
MKFILNIQRKVDYDQARELTFGDSISLKEKLAIAILNPNDYKKLNLTKDSRVNLISQYGQIVVSPKEEKGVPEGMIIMPVSIWANRITGIEEDQLVFKNIEILVETSDKPILTFQELIQEMSSRVR